MKTLRVAVLVAVGTLVAVGCDGEKPSIGRDESPGGATPVETVAPEQIEAIGTGDDGVEPVIIDGGGTGIAASYEFTFADGLVLPTTDGGYVYRANAPIDEDALAKVAGFFDVATESVQNWDEDTISEDSPTVGLGYTASDPLQTWSYYDSDASAELTECTVNTGVGDTSDDADTDSSADVDVCGSPDSPPAEAPNAEAAEAKMSEMLSALGVDPGSVEMATYADPFIATVDATELDEDGVATGRTWTLGLVGGGKPYAASGPLAVPQPVGPYPLVDLEVATSRLSGGWAGGGGSPGGDDLSPEDDDLEPPADGKVPTEPGGITPPPAEPVHIIAVEPDRVWLWDANNDAWMVPAYRFLDAADNRWSVPAIAEDLLTSPGATAPSDVDQQDPSEPTVPTTANPTSEDDVTAPTLPPDADGALTPLLGTATLQEFTTVAESFGLTVRVSTIAGEGQILTEDFIVSRVNVAIDLPADGNRDNAVVVAIDFVG